jgi:hypothetical protein
MVAVMAMTPLHLLHGGATLSVVGLAVSMHIAGICRPAYMASEDTAD